MKITEQNFVQELSRRNEQALEYVMIHYGGLVKSVTHRYLNILSQYEEECISDVFFAVWNHIDSFRPERNPFANWIAGIARLKALDYKRKYARQLMERSLEQADNILSGQPQDTEMSFSGESPESIQTQFLKEFSRETQEILACLKPRDQELFLKLYVEEKSFDEISQETGTEKSVLYNRLSRGKRKLRNLFPRAGQKNNIESRETPSEDEATVIRKRNGGGQ